MLKRNSNLLKLAVALCLSILLLALSLFTGRQEVQPAATETGDGIALQPPAFLTSAHAQDSAQVDFSFIVEEAGITAYTKLDQELDLASLESRFEIIRQQTDQFISGVMIEPGYEKLPYFGENAEVQVFLHRDGWIVAYLTRWQRSAALFDWVNYDAKRLTSTIIENIVRLLALDVGASGFNVSYYDFRYPEANNLMLVAERAHLNKKSDYFDINVPVGITIYENSWSHAILNSGGGCWLNEISLGTFPGLNGWTLVTGELGRSAFRAGATHRLSVTMDGGGLGYCGLAIVYREAVK